jgi:hypothetical protein
MTEGLAGFLGKFLQILKAFPFPEQAVLFEELSVPHPLGFPNTALAHNTPRPFLM